MIDAKQHAKLKAFKKQTLTNALVGEFATIQSLKDQVLRNLTDQVRELKVDKPKRDRLEQQRRIDRPSERLHQLIGRLLAPGAVDSLMSK